MMLIDGTVAADPVERAAAFVGPFV